MLKIVFAATLLLSGMKAHCETLVASYYSYGTKTANGERFRPDGLTAAHKTLPFGTKLLLKLDKKRVWVRVNDRGPFIRGRSLDLSRGAATALGVTGVSRLELLKVVKPKML